MNISTKRQLDVYKTQRSCSINFNCRKKWKSKLGFDNSRRIQVQDIKGYNVDNIIIIIYRTRIVANNRDTSSSSRDVSIKPHVSFNLNISKV